MSACLDGPEMMFLSVLPRARSFGRWGNRLPSIRVVLELLLTARADDGQVIAGCPSESGLGGRGRHVSRLRRNGSGVAVETVSLIVEVNRIVDQGIVQVWRERREWVVTNDFHVDFGGLPCKHLAAKFTQAADNTKTAAK